MENLEEAKMRYQRNFGNVDLDKVYQKLFEILWYSQLPCFDVKNITSEERDYKSILKKCYWKGQVMSCSSIFTMKPTDRGMCCSFNMAKADKIFKDSRYTRALAKMEKQDRKLAFPPNENEKTVLQDLTPQAGLEQGLFLVLDAHSDLVGPGTVYDSFRGFTATITAPNEFPRTKTNRILVKPGQLNMVGVNAINIEADKTMKAMAPEARKCYFPDEFPLLMHKKYSQNNCFLECNINYTRHILATLNKTRLEGCIPWFYPSSDKNTKMCRPWETKDFQENMGTIPNGECDYCLPDCHGNIYETKVDRAEFRKCDHTNLGASMLCDLEIGDMKPSMWTQEARNEFAAEIGNVPQYLMKSVKNKTIPSNRRQRVQNERQREQVAFRHQLDKNPTYDAFDNDIAMVDIYFEREVTQQLKRSQKMTAEDYWSAVGGNCGLGIGFSFISAVEIIYWFTIRFWQNVNSVRKRN